MTFLRTNLFRAFLVGLLLLGTVSIADEPAAAQQAEDGFGIWLVTIPDNPAGWAILNGTGQYVSPECRQSIEDFGGFFEVVEWPVIAETDLPSRDLSCDEIAGLYFAPVDVDDGFGIWLVTIPGSPAGWAILNGTGQYVSPECRQSIEDFGGFFEVCLLYTSPSPRDRG